MNILIGNIISLCAAIFTIISSYQTERKPLYGLQCIQCLLMAIASIFFLSFSGMTTFLLCAFRNYLLAYDKFTKKVCIPFLILITLLGLFANNRGWLGILPIVTTLIYTIGTFILKEPKPIKYNVILNLLLWAIYEGIIQDYVSVIVDSISMIVALISLKKPLKREEV